MMASSNPGPEGNGVEAPVPDGSAPGIAASGDPVTFETFTPAPVSSAQSTQAVPIPVDNAAEMNKLKISVTEMANRDGKVH